MKDKHDEKDIQSAANLISSAIRRIRQLQKSERDNNYGSANRDMFWNNQKRQLYKTIMTLSENKDIIKRGVDGIANSTYLLIEQFRNKVKNDDLIKVRRMVDEWPLEEFTTKERFLKVLREEVNKRQS